MALKDVLSTLRVVLLDDFAALPQEVDQRAQFFREHFPELTPDEVSDFSKIEPKQFEVYTRTIFSGQRSVLKKHFPISFYLMQLHWSDVYQHNFSAFELVKRVHANHPWRGNSTTSLIESFTSFLANDNPLLLEAAPHLLDIVRIEHLALELRRALEQDLEPSADWLQVSNLNVSEFLNVTYSPSETLRFVEFEYDVLPLYRNFHQNAAAQADAKQILPPVPRQKVCAIGVRRFDLAVRWLAVEPSVYAVLQDGADELNTLAEAVIEELPGQSEEAKFQEFVKLVHRLVVNEVICLRY